MDSDALKTFLSVERHGSFSGAANELFRTQPAISSRIKLLEEELGVPLLLRTQPRVGLTEPGRILKGYAEKVAALLSDAESAVRDANSSISGELRICVVGTLADKKFAAALKRFARKFPDVKLGIQTARSAEIDGLVRSGAATIGIRYGRTLGNDLLYQNLGLDSWLVVCSRDHALAGRHFRSITALADQHWFGFPETYDKGGTVSSQIISWFNQLGLDGIRWSPIDSLTAQKRLIEAGFGIALMTQHNAAEELSRGVFSTIDVDRMIAGQPIHLVSRRDNFVTAAVTELVESVRELYSD
jgi:DNA-binding transcriptional LysR family regulator